MKDRPTEYAQALPRISRSRRRSRRSYGRRDIDHEIAQEIDKLKQETYNRYYFVKTGLVLPEASTRLTSVSDISEIDESVQAIRIVEVEESSLSRADERSDTPITFGSQGELDNLLFEIKV